MRASCACPSGAPGSGSLLLHAHMPWPEGAALHRTGGRPGSCPLKPPCWEGWGRTPVATSSTSPPLLSLLVALQEAGSVGFPNLT